MEKNRFELSFSLSEVRFREAHRAYLRHSLLSIKNLFLVTIALMIGAVQAQIFGTANWVLWIFGGLWLGVVGLAIFVYFQMPGRIYKRRIELSGEQKLVVDAEGVDWSNLAGRRLISWKEIDRASDIHPDYVYLHLRHGLPQIIPKDALKNEEDLEAFDRFVHRQILGA